MKHPEREEWIPFIFGEADAGRRQQLESHLEDCAECRDEIQSCARSSASLGRAAIAVHAFGQAPGPNGYGRGSGEPLAHFTQHCSHPLFFGGADISERPPGLEYFTNYSCGAAFGGWGCGIIWRTSIMDESSKN